MRLDINKSMLATATKTAQDGASAVTAAVSLLDCLSFVFQVHLCKHTSKLS